MKNLLIAVTLLCCLPVPVLPQGAGSPVCGTPILRDSALVSKAWEQTLAKVPGAARWSQRRVQPAYVLGAVDTFWVYNFSSSQFESVPARLMAVGTVSYIWVADTEIANGHIDSVAVNEMLQALEATTPAASRDSTKGVVVLDRQYFGNPPNIDANFNKGAGDGKTHFLVCDIKDGWTAETGGGYVAGFFFDVDVDPSYASPYSNRRDMLYIDSYPGIFYNGTRDPERPLGTLAHEFQHLIHWNYDSNEINFFNEGLSEYASYLCGFGLRSPGEYFSNTNIALLSWNSGLDDYSRAALWTLYLYEQYGDTFIKDFTENTSGGISGFEGSLAQAGIPSTFLGTVSDFHVANILRNRSVATAYGYRDTIAAEGSPRLFKNILGPLSAGTRSSLAPLGVDYLRYLGPDTLTATIQQGGGTLAVRALKTADTQTMVSNESVGSPFEMTFEGSNTSSLILVLENSGTGGPASYSYNTQGSAKPGTIVQLAYDDGRTQRSSPGLDANDTVFVWFDGVEGGKIDSVALWFASTGSARLLVRDYNASYDLLASPTSGLGGRTRMSSPVGFTVSDTGFMRTVVDLGQYTIRSSPDFVLEVIYNASVNPLLRRDSSQSTLHSYLSIGSQPTPGRKMYSSLGDFYVRAYLSPAGDLPPVPVVPDQFALLQNYPNPFNPATTIMYDVPFRSRVRLAVYDLLGRVVSVLKDEEEDANQYVVSFDGSRLPSGVYFYRLESPTFNQARKMVLVH